MAAGAAVGSALRDVVLAPAPTDAPAGTMPAAAAAGKSGSTSSVLLSRAYGESQLYTQVRGWQQ